MMDCREPVHRRKDGYRKNELGYVSFCTFTPVCVCVCVCAWKRRKQNEAEGCGQRRSLIPSLVHVLLLISFFSNVNQTEQNGTQNSHPNGRKSPQTPRKTVALGIRPASAWCAPRWAAPFGFRRVLGAPTAIDHLKGSPEICSQPLGN